MLNKLTALIREYDMIRPREHIICAVSGGADSVALLFALHLLQDKLDLNLSAAHFNHHLRDEESNRDEAFVKALCQQFDIPLHLGSGYVRAGEKGLEAAARDARYAFLRSLPGKIATAHTADDNAETVLLHLVRGTGLRGLCGITPVGEGLIRPMLTVTRSEVEAFLQEWGLAYVTDSSNASDAFQRNRLRHYVMPLLKQENPRLAENMSAMALSLQAEEAVLENLTRTAYTQQISQLQTMDAGLRSRILEQFLKDNGVKEPQRSHIALVESLVFSHCPSARASLPGGIIVERCYDTLQVLLQAERLQPVKVAIPGVTQWGGWRVRCCEAEQLENTAETFTLAVEGDVYLRPRQSSDEMRLPGGTKSLKKLFIDRKIPASQRPNIPVLADERGVLGVPGIGANMQRIPSKLPAVRFVFEKEKTLGGF